ncbi:MAG: YeeE/YedE family protein [Myxococcales bacterium]|nr:YeeE/YedE family protein [Myxococcales bacterium]
MAVPGASVVRAGAGRGAARGAVRRNGLGRAARWLDGSRLRHLAAASGHLVGRTPTVAASRAGTAEIRVRRPPTSTTATNDLAQRGSAARGLGWAPVSSVSKPNWRPRAFHRGSVPGGILFGVGWAVSGACPSIALVSLGEGQFAAIATLIGLFAGNLAYGVVHRRWLHWHTNSCLDD